MTEYYLALVVNFNIIFQSASVSGRRLQHFQHFGIPQTLAAIEFTQNQHMKKGIRFLLVLLGLSGTAQAQKGEISIAGGPLISIPIALGSWGSPLKIGPGAEIIGQYNFSNRSAFVLKTTVTSWAYKEEVSANDAQRFSLLSLQGGYRYQFGASGFFVDGLLGVDIDTQDDYNTGVFTIGACKRFLKKKGFIDVGIDIVGADADERINVKVLFSFFRWNKEKELK